MSRGDRVSAGFVLRLSACARISVPSVLLALLLCPDARAQDMSSLWPNDDGHSWTYRQTYVEDLWVGGDAIENEVRFYLDGYGTVPGGIAVQNLRLQVLSASGRSSSAVAPILGDNPMHDPFLRGLWWARPDLRAALQEGVSNGKIEETPPGYYQLLLSEGAYRKSETEIAAWREDQDAMMSWLWLISDIEPGATFSLQLVPDLADNVWLHGTVTGWEDVDVPAGTFHSLRVDYLIDYGISTCVDGQGQETGSIRSETRGWIDYAPWVGPVKSHELFVPVAEVLSGDCPGIGHLGEALTEGGLELGVPGPVPVQAVSWGRLKALYR